MEILAGILSGLLIIAGLIGVVVPFFIGIPLIFVGIFLFGVLTGFKEVSGSLIILSFVLTLISIAVDYLSSLVGAKKFGVSPLGIVGLFVGLLFGLFLAGPLGVIFGPVIGVVLFEFAQRRKIHQALRAGTGVLLGYIVGTSVNLIIAIILVLLFLRAIF